MVLVEEDFCELIITSLFFFSLKDYSMVQDGRNCNSLIFEPSYPSFHDGSLLSSPASSFVPEQICKVQVAKTVPGGGCKIISSKKVIKDHSSNGSFTFV